MEQSTIILVVLTDGIDANGNDKVSKTTIDLKVINKQMRLNTYLVS